MTTQQHDDDFGMREQVVVTAEFNGHTGYVVAIDGATKAQIESELVARAQVTSMQLGQVVVPSNGVSPALVRYPLTSKLVVR